MVHPPFPHCPDPPSISSGVTANESINCYSAVEEGQKNKFKNKKIFGCLFTDIHIRRKDKVSKLASMNQAIKIHDNVILINTMQQPDSRTIVRSI